VAAARAAAEALVRHAEAAVAHDRWVGAVARGFATAGGGPARAGPGRAPAAPPGAAVPTVLLDEPAGEGRRIEVYGDLAGATSVVVLVPGMGATRANFAERVGPRARDLWARAVAAGTTSVAVVAWLGYDAPDALPSIEVASAEQAWDGGRALVDFVAGLALAPGTTLTVVGHSYGSVVVGAAVRLGLVARNVVGLGSPGMLARRAADLHAAPGTRLFTMEAPGDLVAALGRFGGDPNDPWSGFTRLATGDVEFHGGYLADGSLSQANLVALARGDDASLVRRGTSPLERVEIPLEAVRERARATFGGLPGYAEADRVVAGAEDLVDAVAGTLHVLARRLW
jgi:hypothetical protein